MRNKLSLRIIASLMIAVMLVASFAACAETGSGEETTAASADTAPASSAVEETTADPTKDANGYLKDDLPEDLKFNDDITLLVWDDVEHEEFEIAYENLSGDIVEQSLYDRNSKVEQRLGLTLNFIRVNGNTDNVKNWNAYVGNSVSINAREFDIIASYSVSVAKNATSGYLFNMLEDECEYLNFEQPWWSDLLLEQATFGDNLYFASGDISRNALEMMYVCFVNTVLLEKHNLENPQDLVDSNDWTYEKFMEMCKGIYEDTDGDGFIDEPRFDVNRDGKVDKSDLIDLDGDGNVGNTSVSYTDRSGWIPKQQEAGYNAKLGVNHPSCTKNVNLTKPPSYIKIINNDGVGGAGGYIYIVPDTSGMGISDGGWNRDASAPDTMGGFFGNTKFIYGDGTEDFFHGTNYVLQNVTKTFRFVRID